MAHHRRCFRLTRHRLLRIKQYVVIWLISSLSLIGLVMLLTYIAFGHNVPAVDSAKASNIVSNMRSLKNAAISWYDDNKDRISLLDGKYILDGNADNTLDNLIISDDFILDVFSYTPYLQNDLPINENYRAGKYSFSVLNDGLYIGYFFSKREDKVREKLSGRAKSIGLVKADGKTLYDKDYEVYMLIVNLSGQGDTR